LLPKVSDVFFHTKQRGRFFPFAILQKIYLEKVYSQIGCSNWSVPSWWGTKHEWFLVLPVGLLGRYLLGVSTPALSDWRARYCLHSKGFGGNSRKVGSGRNRRRVGSGRNRRRVGRRWKPSRNRRTRVVLITSKVLLLDPRLENLAESIFWKRKSWKRFEKVRGSTYGMKWLRGVSCNSGTRN
jgi:hypothetical protein